MPASNIQYQGNYFSIFTNKSGEEFVYTANEALIVPLTAQGEVILTTEPSVAFDEPVLILPGGEVEQGEDPGETAVRELQEEIGHAPGRLDFLGEIRPFSKYLTLRSFIYLGRNLTVSQLKGDENYIIGTERVPLSTFEDLIGAGRLLDARVIAALSLARSFLQSGTP